VRYLNDGRSLSFFLIFLCGLWLPREAGCLEKTLSRLIFAMSTNSVSYFGSKAHIKTSNRQNEPPPPPGLENIHTSRQHKDRAGRAESEISYDWEIHKGYLEVFDKYGFRYIFDISVFIALK
jgi:hypothetical protein